MRLMFGRVECISKAIHPLIESKRDYLFQSGEMCEKLGKVTAHCRALFKDENEKQPANLGGHGLQNIEPEKKQKDVKYLFYR